MRDWIISEADSFSREGEKNSSTIWIRGMLSLFLKTLGLFGFDCEGHTFEGIGGTKNHDSLCV
jgi:hypothetical protein